MSIRNIPQTDAAWLAGLFEGEGYLSRIPGNGVRMGINMCDEDVVRRAYELAGGSFRDKPAGNPRHKPQWLWQVTNWPDVLSLCAVLLPFMGQRRRAKMESVIAEAAADGRLKGSYRPCSFELGISNKGYVWHQRTGNLPACDSCMASYQLYMARWRTDNRNKIVEYRATYRQRKQDALRNHGLTSGDRTV